VARDTIVVPYNDVSTLQEVVEARGEEIAAIILEPVAANMGLVLPQEGFLDILRELTEEYGIVLIFDEVVSGFRLGYGGAQTLYGVKPDLTTLGKIVGGGVPCGAYGGRKTLMDEVSPQGEVYQAGTLAGNCLATAAGIETLRQLQAPGLYEALEDKTSNLVEGLREAAKAAGVPAQVNLLGSCFTVFFTEHKVNDFAAARRSDTVRYARFFHAMLAEGVYLPPSQFETCFVSTAHSDEDIEQTLAAAEVAFKKILA